jgi:hypothetical protein
MAPRQVFMLHMSSSIPCIMTKRIMLRIITNTSKDELGNSIPKPGEWPVDPQQDVPVSDDRIWIDGCFDFSHHGSSPAFSNITIMDA